MQSFQSNHRALVVCPQVLRLLRSSAAIPNVENGLGADLELPGDGSGLSCQERVCLVAVGLGLTVTNNTVRIHLYGLGRCKSCPRVMLEGFDPTVESANLGELKVPVYFAMSCNPSLASIQV